MRKAWIVTHRSGEVPHGEMLAWGLEQIGWEVTLCAPGGQGVVKQTLGGNWSCRSIARRGMRFEIDTLKAIVGADRSGADIVCIDGVGLAYRAALARFLPMRRAALAYFNPDFCTPNDYRWRSMLEGRLARQAALHVNHEYHRAYFMREHHRMRCPILVVPPSLPICWPIPDPDKSTRAELAGDAGERAVLLRLHGGYHPLRRLEETMAALSLLPKFIRLVMTDFGGGCHPLMELLDGYRLRDRVVLLPHLSFNEMLKYTVNCDIGLLLYRNNDFGNYFQAPGRLSEYLACGLPVLASRFAGLENLVEQRRIGVCVEGSRPEDIARGVGKIAEARCSGLLGHRHIRKRFVDDFAYDHWLGRISAAFARATNGIVNAPDTEVDGPWWPWYETDC